MGRSQSRSTLNQSITDILGTAKPSGKPAMYPEAFRKSLICTSMAMLAINPVLVNAISLGEISVNSRLGQPLDASVPLTLAAGESMPKGCVAPAKGSDGFSTPSQLRINSPAAMQPGTYSLRVTTSNALYEPMYEISLLIDCPGTPLLLRTYVLMLDLPGIHVSAPETEQANISGDTLTVPATTRQAPSQPVIQTIVPETSQRVERSVQRSETAIPAGQPYRVSSGDTLSTIAARVVGRSPDTTWSVANHIYLSNPQAFISNNPNLIKLGSLIKIPSVTELSGIEKGHTSKTLARTLTVTAKPATTQPEPIKESRLPTVPAPIPAPVATQVTREQPETFITEPMPKQSDMTLLNSGEKAVVDITTEKNQPVITQPAATFPAYSAAAIETADTAIITPFLDEQPVSASDSNTSESAVPPIPVTSTTARNEPSNPVNPMVAILVGILLGALISLLTLRRPLTEAFTRLFNRRTALTATRTRKNTAPRTAKQEDTTAGAKTFDTSVADTAFETQQEQDEPLPITDPAECTYIVEASGPDTIQNLATLQVNSDDEMLAQLFADDELTADDPRHGVFDPTGSFDAAATSTFTEHKEQMPAQIEADDSDPAAEFNSEIFNQINETEAGQPDFLPAETVDMAIDASEPLESTLIS
ncbi:MAG: LysM peptidoglycan-binding domain-containing protein, partial [Gammaproteobacteria bacterium]|nr:LysM peptidoglycan-binding domain-containing protein [Gammaproteobacteria bacterium]